MRSKLVNPDGQPGDRSAAFVKLLDRLDRLHHLVLHEGHLVLEPILADRQDALLDIIEQAVDLTLLLVRSARRIPCMNR